MFHSFSTSLALAMLYISLANVFRNYQFELFETDVSDTRVVADHFVPVVKDDSKGIRVKVQEC